MYALRAGVVLLLLASPIAVAGWRENHAYTWTPLRQPIPAVAGTVTTPPFVAEGPGPYDLVLVVDGDLPDHELDCRLGFLTCRQIASNVEIDYAVISDGTVVTEGKAGKALWGAGGGGTRRERQFARFDTEAGRTYTVRVEVHRDLAPLGTPEIVVAVAGGVRTQALLDAMLRWVVALLTGGAGAALIGVSLAGGALRSARATSAPRNVA
jgi:hypothetical protein